MGAFEDFVNTELPLRVSTAEGPNLTVGHLRSTGVGRAVTAIKDNVSASADPAATDDSAAGYAVGSRWLNTTADTAWLCLDATASAAVWKDITASGGGATVLNDLTDVNTAGEATSNRLEYNGSLWVPVTAVEKTRAAVIYLGDQNYPPLVGDRYPMAAIPKAATIKYAEWVCNGTSTPTVDFNIELVAVANPLTATTGIWTAVKQAGATTLNTVSFDTPAVAARTELWCRVDATGGAPDTLVVYVEWELN